ncbi:P2X purinoceptor 7-like isoform X2 [Pipistrellus kuhlii]|uniref:P2X purinoceptor 7-like isoform X2 n=1 Tax=Pipistrellus kuhlii TaxID=59472 RepID=UPI001E26F46E|nr:P2X purinoceptor 7-like isoform X2 [Pipistrellus kuhlii]
MPARCQFPQICQSVQVAKVIPIQILWIGILKNLIIAGILVYICYGLVCQKRHQWKVDPASSVHTKVKGIAEVREEILENGKKKEVLSVFDPADYTFPLQENSFFVMTNFLKTKGQVRGLCPEYPSQRTRCSSDRDCKNGWLDPQSEGIQTGKCVVYNQTIRTCEVSAWCPTEALEEPPGPALLNNAENFTVFIQNNIHFHDHNYTTSNVWPDLNINCTFHKTQNPQCPNFRLGDIFRETGEDFSEVAIKGGIMGIDIYWDCNLDSWFHHCRPNYSFRRLDKIPGDSLNPGFEFRYAKYYQENNVEKRTLMKVFGIRFDILVLGKGGKFDLFTLIEYLGSTLPYFGLALVIDLIICTWSSKCCKSNVYRCCKCCQGCAVNEYYYKKKYETVVEPKSTLKYVSFVDEFHIRMVDEEIEGESLQDVKGKEIPRPLMDFTDLSRLPLSLQDPPSIPGQPGAIQLLSEEATTRSSSSPSWCQCGNCLPSQLPEIHQGLEELCCRKKPGACITTSEPFRRLILSRRALQFLLLYQEPLLELDADATNNQLRHCAYRCYAIWRFGSKDLADFAILPSCCRWRIRKEFPKSEGQYSGFKNPYLKDLLDETEQS